ncbi:MAG: hypothetical protein GXX83_10095 [Gaiellales bacterium]|nr:hypothetical protein [Gaiellales bacterium]
MPVTVAQILKLESLTQARILAGREGLARTVSSVTVGEVPDIAEWLSGGEMVLSTMFALINDVGRQREFCQRIMAAGASALFVKPKRFVGKFPEDVLQIADRRQFPIVEVPQQVRWTRIMQEATEVLINRQATLLEKSQAIHRELLDVVIRGGGWADLAEAVARLTEMPVIILDVSLEVLALTEGAGVDAASVHSSLDRPEIRAQFEELGRPLHKELRLVRHGLPQLFAVPVIASRSRLGYVCVLTSRSELQDMERVALEHAATVAAVEMAQDQVRFETEVRLRGDFVDDLAGGRFDSRDSLLRRANFLGCDLSHGATVMVIAPDIPEGKQRSGQGETECQQLIERFFGRLARLVLDVEPNSLATLKSERIVLLLADPIAKEPKALDQLAEHIQALARDVTRWPVTVGLSRHTPEPTGLSAAMEEAAVSVKVGRRLRGIGSVTHFDQMGTYKLLFGVWERDSGELQSLYEETVAPVDAYDQHNDTQLLRTLMTYLKNDESLSKTAEELYAHRHTIRYRLQKIAEITGLSVFRSEDKERLGLGLKARHLLSA